MQGKLTMALVKLFLNFYNHFTGQLRLDTKWFQIMNKI